MFNRFFRHKISKFNYCRGANTREKNTRTLKFLIWLTFFPPSPLLISFLSIFEKFENCGKKVRSGFSSYSGQKNLFESRSCGFGLHRRRRRRHHRLSHRRRRPVLLSSFRKSKEKERVDQSSLMCA